MKQMNYNRLKKARLYRGITTVEELAKKIGITKQALSQYETNKSDIPFKQMLEIARILDFPIDYFTQSDEKSFNLEPKSVYFRSLMRTNKKYRKQQIIKMEYISFIYLVLSKYINFPAINLPSLKENDAIENDTIENMSIELRKHWNLGNEPISDLVRITEKQGFILTQFETETDDIDAFSQLFKIDDKDIYLIALSKNKNTSARIHFDVAHELGHVLLHEWNEDNELLSKEEFKTREKEANEFASAFLLPKDEFINDISRYPTQLDYYIELKKKWKVSIAAMIYRAQHLKVINQTQYSSLVKKMSAKGWRTREPLDDILKTAKPSLLETAIDMLLANNVFTKKELLKEIKDSGFAINSREIEILLNLPKDKLKIGNSNIVHIKDILNIKK